MPRPLPLGTPSALTSKPGLRKLSSTKRPHSPDLALDTNASQSKPKRAKGPEDEEERKAKESRRVEREQQKAEFKAKYTKAFPSWVFHFDSAEPEGSPARKAMEEQITILGGVRFWRFISETVSD